MYVPMVRALQSSFPQAKLYWIISDPAYDLVKNIPDVEFIRIHKPKNLTDYWNLYRQFRPYHFDVLLATQASFRTNLIYPLISAKRKIGYDKIRSRDGHQWFIDESIPLRQIHTLESFMQFAEHLGADVSQVIWDLPLEQSAQQWAQQILKEAKSAPGPWIAINPAASKSERTWSTQYYIDLIARLKTTYAANIVLTGGPGTADRFIADAITSAAQVLDMVGHTKLAQLMALINEVDLVICPDTGPSHMAAALNTPVIALHAVTRPEISGPYGQLDFVVNKYEEALARYGKQEDWFMKVHHPEVMHLITVDDVMEKVSLLL